MTKVDLIDEVARVVEMTRKDSEVIVESIFDSVVKALRADDKIEIRGFGSFRTRQRQARGGAGQADSLLQAEQGVEGSGELRRRTG
jgi:integration host factor subunit beta